MERLGDHLRQAEKKIAALEAKLQAREPIGQPRSGTPIDAWMRLYKEKQEQPSLLPPAKFESRGYVDPNRPDQAKAVVLPTGVKITGVSASGASVAELINKFWAENAQAAQAQADRDGENLKE